MDERAHCLERILALEQRIMEATLPDEQGPFLELDLTMPQLKVLLLLAGPGHATGTQLARGVGVGLSSLTGIIDRLCDAGLVTRGEDPDDRRATRVTLTPAGRTLIERLRAAGLASRRRLFSRLGLETLRLLVHAYERVVIAVDMGPGDLERDPNACALLLAPRPEPRTGK